MKKFIFLFIFTCVYFLETEEIPKEEFIIKGWENALSKIKSAECKYVVEGERKILPEGKFIKRKLYECEWKYKNGKELLKSKSFDEKGEIILSNEFYFDGENTLIISFNKNEKYGSILEGKAPQIFTFLPPSMFLWYFYPGISYKELISSSQINMVREERINTDICYLISVEKEILKSKIYILFWFSKDKDFLPIKIENIRKQDSMITEIYYIKTDDIWFPKKIVGWKKEQDGTKTGYTIAIYEYIRINEEIKDEEFKFNFEPGTVVYDTRLGVSFEIKK